MVSDVNANLRYDDLLKEARGHLARKDYISAVKACHQARKLLQDRWEAEDLSAQINFDHLNNPEYKAKFSIPLRTQLLRFQNINSGIHRSLACKELRAKQNGSEKKTDDWKRKDEAINDRHQQLLRAMDEIIEQELTRGFLRQWLVLGQKHTTDSKQFEDDFISYKNSQLKNITRFDVVTNARDLLKHSVKEEFKMDLNPANISDADFQRITELTTVKINSDDCIEQDPEDTVVVATPRYSTPRPLSNRIWSWGQRFFFPSAYVKTLPPSSPTRQDSVAEVGAPNVSATSLPGPLSRVRSSQEEREGWRQSDDVEQEQVKHKIKQQKTKQQQKGNTPTPTSTPVSMISRDCVSPVLPSPKSGAVEFFSPTKAKKSSECFLITGMKTIPAHEVGITRDQFSKLFPKSMQAVQVLEKQYYVYATGGSVRDLLLNRKPKDLDVVVRMNQVTIEQGIADLIDKLKKSGFVGTPMGGAFPIVRVTQGSEQIDFAILVEYKDNPYPTTNNSFLYGDVMGRDFTCHLNYYNFNTSTFYSLQYDRKNIEEKTVTSSSGHKDIEGKILRAIGEPEKRFKEDPIRMLRAITLKNKLAFTLDKKLETSIPRYANYIANVHSARLLTEVEKLLVMDRPLLRNIIQDLRQYGLLQALYQNLNGSYQQTEHATRIKDLFLFFARVLNPPANFEFARECDDYLLNIASIRAHQGLGFRRR